MSHILDEIVPFRGKHEGKPLGQILRCDRGWVEWAAETVEPDDTEKVVLATGLRSKGDENKRVFVLNYSWLPFMRSDCGPSPLASMSDEQSRQEDYVHYVILTRSSGALYLLDDGHDSILKEKPEAGEESENLMQSSKEQMGSTHSEQEDFSVNLAHIRELITELVEIVKTKKYYYAL